MATTIYHGPGAREAAIDAADAAGRLLAPPFGDDRLKVDTSREIVETLSSVPVGDRLGTLVIGPFDQATPEASDGLLKLLEEFDGRYIRPVLWAHDLGGVAPTIRSRCLHEWCPGDPDASPEAAYLAPARALCEAALRRRLAAVVENFNESKGTEVEVLRASAEVLVGEDGWPLHARVLLWDSIRATLAEHGGQPTPMAVLAAYMV